MRLSRYVLQAASSHPAAGDGVCEELLCASNGRLAPHLTNLWNGHVDARPYLKVSTASLMQLVLVYAGRLLCGSLQTLAGWYPTDQFAPTSQPGQLERFVDKREAAGSLQAPQYHKATDAEVGACWQLP